jgi:predicted transcriptional regulator
MTDALLYCTTQIVAAHLQRNVLDRKGLPAFISEVFNALAGLNKTTEPATRTPVPAVPVGQSVTPDYIVCLDDGLRFRTLRRHLGVLGMTDEQYRDKWNLPDDYPMVAPNYSSTRSQIARIHKLGKRAVE